MQIFGPYRVSATQATQGNSRITPAKPVTPGESSRSAGPVDQLDLSAAAQGASRVSDNGAVAGGGEIRLERVAAIRRAIADGSYETPEKLDVAMNRLLDDLA